MLNHVRRRSRLGIAQVWLIAGGVAAAALVGYVAYKWWKGRQNPTSYSQYAPGGNGYGQQQGYQQQQQYMPPTPKKGYAYQPTNTSRDATGQDPELNRLFAAAQQAQMQFNAALASGDQGRAQTARQNLAVAQDALNAKKASMY